MAGLKRKGIELLTNYETVADKAEKTYHEMLNDSDVLKLDRWQQRVIMGGFKRNMCMKKAMFLSHPDEVSKECKTYDGR